MNQERIAGDGAESGNSASAVPDVVPLTDSGESGSYAASTTAQPPSTDSDSRSRWIPNKNYLRALKSMGISKRDAIKALYHTNNSSADQAASWVFENDVATVEMPPGLSAYDALSSPDGSSASSSGDENDDFCDELHKMVFVVNSELGMGIGKVGAQVGHASIGLFRILMSDEFKYGRMLCAWEDSGETKICLKGKNAAELLELEKNAQQLELPCYLVEDAGRTQIPAGSLTVLSIIGKVEDVNKITGDLKLL
ncbi:probable peptidyl-tRNA hydrolase 2 [Galendromus occidentalis]|uniref:peptidyl-tRNA hydrolase n=1 Tax=Galendromus occidentalis TaxID=34638 RepID=A0AAJ6QWQ0_9ACAR|nr:probable peptidyl-tRNA hydrolase 2 [Galendromus occidentalis]